MRNALLAFAVASLATLSSVAHADPISVAATTTDDTAPTTYVQGGLMVGGNDGLFTAGANAEAGKRVTDNIWVHGSFTEGVAEELFAHGTGNIMQARIGADAMTCGSSGVLCAYLGADVGFQRTQFSGTEDSLGWGSDGSNPATMVDYSHNRAIGVARIGLDIGSKNVRWRPGIEASFANDGADGVNLTQSIAYRF